MVLNIIEIYFNHNRLGGPRWPPGSGPTTSALYIRQNQDFESPWPEYEAGKPSQQIRSRVAYAIKDTTGQDVFIWVKFTKPETANAAYKSKPRMGASWVSYLQPR